VPRQTLHQKKYTLLKFVLTELSIETSRRKSNLPRITEIGQACRHCDTPVIKRDHGNKIPQRNKGGYWFEWWLACPKCSAVYFLESAKRYYVDRPTSDTIDNPRIVKYMRLIEERQSEIAAMEKKIEEELALFRAGLTNRRKTGLHC
jgi:hypothetical protein